MQRQCSGLTKSGERCKSFAMPDSERCIAHGDRVTDLAAWRKRGGEGKANEVRARKALPSEPLSTVEVHAHLSTAFRRALAGKMDPPLLNALSSAGRTLAELQKSSEIEERLIDLERRLTGRVS